jgi:hypothetical protein
MSHHFPQRFYSRRELLNRVGGGIAGLAFAQMASGMRTDPMAPRKPHFPAKATNVISIFCYGGVSQMDTFDPKPMLDKHQGEVLTGKGDVVVSQGTPGGLMPSPWKFKKYGQCGMDVSELFPHVGSCVDDIGFVRSMYAISNDHARLCFR